MKLRLVLAGTVMLAGLALPGCSTSQRRLAPGHSTTAEASTNFPVLPEAVTSFGAVTVDDWLYVFGGHKGERHEYAAATVSGSFWRLRLSDGRTWEALPPSTPAQGLPLVTHRGYVYRIGGMAAR